MDVLEIEPWAGIAAFGSIVVILLIWLIVLTWRLARLRKNYNRMLNGHRAENVEQLLIAMQDRLNAFRQEVDMLKGKVAGYEERLAQMKSRTGLLRYNAFSEQGHDLSFSLAIIDDRQNGVVLSGIHNREQVFVYAKPIEQGIPNTH